VPNQQIEIEVLSAAGKKSGTKSVPAEVFATKPNIHLLNQVVRWQRAKKRAGTHTVKTRAEARGGGVKPWKQKGTGRARAGSNTSPLWVGGGIAHGPKQRSYEFSINKKERALALAGAISARQSAAKLIAVDDFSLKTVKTKDAVAVLAKVGVAKGASAVVVCANSSETLRKSLKNVAGVKLIDPAGLNVYDILKAEYLIFVGDALEQVGNSVAATRERRAAVKSA